MEVGDGFAAQKVARDRREIDDAQPQPLPEDHEDGEELLASCVVICASKRRDENRRGFENQVGLEDRHERKGLGGAAARVREHVKLAHQKVRQSSAKSPCSST